MSLQPVSIYVVPEQTARVARAAFHQSNLCMRLYDQLGTIFQDQDFADLLCPFGGGSLLEPRGSSGTLQALRPLAEGTR